MVWRAIWATSVVEPLKENAVARDTMDSADTLPRSVMMSSVMPSLKYSCSGSPLMLAKGSTQIETAGRLSFSVRCRTFAADSFSFRLERRRTAP